MGSGYENRYTVHPDPEDNPLLQHRMRIKAEEREAKAHAAAAALDECLTLLLSALRQAADTPRGMQARRARRLLSKFTSLRMDALDGKSPCSPKHIVEILDEAVESTNRLVR